MAEGVDTADAEGQGHGAWSIPLLQAGQRSHELAIYGGVGVAVAGQPRYAFHDPRRLAESLQVLAQAGEGRDHVEVVDAHEVALAGVEEDELALREGLEGPSESRR